MSNFDPDSFLDQSTDKPLESRTPLPAGADFTGTIQDVKAASFQGKKDPTKTYVRLDVVIEVDVTSNPGVFKSVGYPSIRLTDGVLLDTTEAGGIDWSPGRNGKLRSYREALGMNKAGDTFSPRGMVGRMIKVKIKHDPYEGVIYDRIDRVAKA